MEERGAISTEQLERTARDLSMRGLQLWSLAFVLMIVLASGILCLVLPNTGSHFRIEIRYMPQLASGLIALVVLANLYFIQKHQSLERARSAAVRELAANETYDKFAVLDPLTLTYRRAYLNEMLEKEVIRANRENT